MPEKEEKKIIDISFEGTEVTGADYALITIYYEDGTEETFAR